MPTSTFNPMRLLLTLVMTFACVFGYGQRDWETKEDSIKYHKEMAEWEASKPYCDSTKAWYYYWSYRSPDGGNGWGEYTMCQYKKPTVKEVVANIRKTVLTKSDWSRMGRYLKVGIIVEEKMPNSWCHCKDRTRGF